MRNIFHYSIFKANKNKLVSANVYKLIIRIYIIKKD